MLRYMTAGESHGKGLMAILDGVPAGFMIDDSVINRELARRMVGYGRGGRMKIEKDKVDIIAGCRRKMTIGSPVGMVIYNEDYKINDLPDIKCPRPGHADLAGVQKYDLKSARDVLERASARETAARVAVGAVMKMMLKEFGVRILSHVVAIGKVEAKTEDLSFDRLWELSEVSELRCADASAETRMRKEIDKATKAGDTLGGSFEVIADGVPPGLGSYAQWDRRLDGALARSITSIPAIKAVSIGKGIESSGRKGSESHDEIVYDSIKSIFDRLSNNAGGVEGGMTNGLPVVVRGFMKPIATLGEPLRSVDIDSKAESTAAVERADITAVAAAGVVAEAAMAFEIASAFLEKFGGDSIEEIKRNYKMYVERLHQM